MFSTIIPAEYVEQFISEGYIFGLFLTRRCFIRTVEIEITPASYATYGKSYWDKMAIAIKTQIESRSIDGVTYVVRVINKD